MEYARCIPCRGNFRLECRASASTGSKKLGALKYNTKINVIGMTGDWAMIKYNGKTAYVALKYICCVA